MTTNPPRALPEEPASRSTLKPILITMLCSFLVAGGSCFGALRTFEEASRGEDVIPVPCHPDALAMAYALKLDGKVVPLTGMIEPQLLIDGARNTIVYEEEHDIRDCLFKLFSTNHSPESGAASLRDLLCCLPRITAPTELTYKNIFRVLIVQFLDAHAFDVRSVKKTCIHIVHPDGRLIPFDTYNLFYRDDLERARLKPLRQTAALVSMGTPSSTLVSPASLFARAVKSPM